MLAILVAVVGGVSFTAGAGWHDEFPGADSALGFHLHVGGGTLTSETSSSRLSAILVVQGLTLGTQNNDDEFPAEWHRQMLGISVGLRFDKGRFSALATIGEGIATNRFGPGGGNDSGMILSATAGFAIWRALHLDATLTKWMISAQSENIGATTLSSGVGFWF